MTDRKYVKLNFYRHESDTTTIDGYEAEDWGDFLVVAVNMEGLGPSEFEHIQAVFAEHTAGMEKKVIIVPKELNIEFFGVEIAE